MSDVCQNCESDRIATVNGKTNDLCVVEIAGEEHEGYVPTDMGIGGGDYLSFSYCLECGQMQGDFPLDETDLETGATDEEDDYESDEWREGDDEE